MTKWPAALSMTRMCTSAPFLCPHVLHGQFPGILGALSDQEENRTNTPAGRRAAGRDPGGATSLHARAARAGPDGTGSSGDALSRLGGQSGEARARGNVEEGHRLCLRLARRAVLSTPGVPLGEGKRDLQRTGYASLTCG